MIYGLDWAYWTEIKDQAAMLSGQRVIDIALVRAHDGWRNDTKFVSNRKLLVNATTANGSVLWSPYAFLGYGAQVGSTTWTTIRGDAQAANFWALVSAGGVEFQLPPAVDAEHNAFTDANNVRQYVPLPSADTYVDTYLLPWIEYMSSAINRRPLFYSSPNIILNYLAPVLSKPKCRPILECELWLAGYSGGDVPPYWNAVDPARPDYRVSAYWPRWLIWQYKGDVKDWPGVSDVDLNKCAGTRAQWKAWGKDSTAPVPSETGVDPGPVIVPAPVPVIDLSGLEKQVQAVQADVAAIKAHFSSSLGVG